MDSAKNVISEKKIIAIVLSGGIGSRIDSDIPKQYIEVEGRPIIDYCIDTLDHSDKIDEYVIVADANWRQYISDSIERNKINSKFAGFVNPGETRQLSIYNALLYIRENISDVNYVFIHDAARPMLTVKIIEDCIENLDGHDGVMPALPMKDTVYVSNDGEKISSLIDRNTIFAGQAPEVFLFEKYIKANEKLVTYTDDSDKSVISPRSDIFRINGSTEPAILAGMDISIIKGNEKNYKITTNEDLKKFRRDIAKN